MDRRNSELHLQGNLSRTARLRLGSTDPQGEPGDVANIPYVKDADFEQLGAVGNAFNAGTTGLISSVTTTLYEQGLWSDIDYYFIERINQNLLNEINSMLARAAVRAEMNA